MAPIAQSHQIPLITPTATHPKVTEAGDYVFRVCFTEPFQGKVLAKFAIEHLHAKKAAILYDVKSDYSTGLVEMFTHSFTQSGGKIVAVQTFTSGDLDFKSQLTAIRAQNPDLLVVPNYYTDTGLIARQVRELGLQAVMLGGDAWDSPKLNEIAGKAIEGSFFSNHYAVEQEFPEARKFVRTFKEKYGVLPDGTAALGYDAAGVLLASLQRSSSLSPKDIRNTIAALQNYQGATGQITFQGKRDPVKSAIVMKVTHGEFKYQTTVKP
jgi:branched-chain amino acid transport system substrate-binding protein